MAIGSARQRGTLVYLYDYDGRQITSIAAPGRWPGDGLKSHTETTVTIQKGTLLYTYNEQGHLIGAPSRLNTISQSEAVCA